MQAVAGFLGEELAKQRYEYDDQLRDLFDDTVLAVAR